MYVKRTIEKQLVKAFRTFPIITLTGPRQSGKTTLVRHLFKDMPYVNLEDIEEREFALTDPKGFLRRFKDGAVLDEIQKVPSLLSYIQVTVDEAGKNGMFVLTGSNNFLLMKKVQQTLAGRTAIFHLLPFSISESQSAGLLSRDINEILIKGFYPGVLIHQQDPKIAISSYIQTYIERDLGELINVKNRLLFRRFMKLCAGRIGQILNLSSLSNDLGVSHTTIREWISVLEASYIIFLLPPFFANIRKRLIKSPKLYFYDTSIASFLLGIERPSDMDLFYLKGNLFESMIVTEMLKHRFNHARSPELYFYRDSSGNEVDVFYEKGDHIFAFEVKSSYTISSDHFKGLRVVQRLLGKERLSQYLVYLGDRSEQRGGISIINYLQLPEVLDSIDNR